ncbi:sodium-dependent glucose transporter 1-like [Rhipicephalus sanguineus]|uniref:sodium-dependent glucose transporter 1-like n=1 Tax=Rhipicephalus sanguineus TaxID=34632 RepID=UPI0020C392EF|nr:sodium-dependent glucose transporter 1-like [Rhipicephalus sanguineus]
MSSRKKLWLNLGRTSNLSLGNLAMGLIVSITGVALLDLAELYGSRLASISYLLTTRGVGHLLGSLLGGKLFDTYNTQLITILAMAVTCAAVVLTPLGGYLALAHIAIFLCGLGIASFITGASVWIIRMWPANTSPPLQVFHLAFGIGGILGPFVARPFLSAGTGENSTALNVTETADQSHIHTSLYPVDLMEMLHPATAGKDMGTSHVYCAFGIAGGLYLAVTISLVLLYFVDNRDFKAGAVPATNDTSLADNRPSVPVRYTRTVLAFMCIYSTFNAAHGNTTSEMLASFAVKSDLRFSKSTASGVESTFFLCVAASRLCAALVTIKVPVFWILVLAHVILLPTAAVLAVFGSRSAAVFWAGAALTGIDSPARSIRLALLLQRV